MRETTYTYYLNIWFSDTNCPKWHIKNPSVEKIKEIILAQFGVYEEDIDFGRGTADRDKSILPSSKRTLE